MNEKNHDKNVVYEINFKREGRGRKIEIIASCFVFITSL